MPDVVTFGEAMIRLSPPHFQRLDQTAALDVQVGGGELSVAEGATRLGLTSTRLSGLTQNSRGHLAENRALLSAADTSPLLLMLAAHSTMI